MAPLSLDPRKKQTVSPPALAVQLDAEQEYAFVRRDLWRLVLFSIICFLLMIGTLLWLNA